MGPFEYLLTFASVLLALALSDIVVSLNRLLGAGRRVKWDWLAPLAAFVAFLKIVNQWWIWFAAKTLAVGITFGMFLAVLVSAVLLFLLSAASLPDTLDEADLDLRAYYDRVSRRYWLLFTGHWLVGLLASIWVQMSVEGAHFSIAQPAFLILPAALAPVFIRARWLHATWFVLFAALYLILSFAHRLTA